MTAMSRDDLAFQIGAVWEALPDNIVAAHDDPADAVKDVLALRDQQIAVLRKKLGEARAHAADLDRAMVPLMEQVTTIEEDISTARTEGYRTGRMVVIDRVAAAIDESPDNETFMRGVVATLLTDPTWGRKP